MRYAVLFTLHRTCYNSKGYKNGLVCTCKLQSSLVYTPHNEIYPKFQMQRICARSNYLRMTWCHMSLYIMSPISVDIIYSFSFFSKICCLLFPLGFISFLFPSIWHSFMRKICECFLKGGGVGFWHTIHKCICTISHIAQTTIVIHCWPGLPCSALWGCLQMRHCRSILLQGSVDVLEVIISVYVREFAWRSKLLAKVLLLVFMAHYCKGLGKGGAKRHRKERRSQEDQWLITWGNLTEICTAMIMILLVFLICFFQIFYQEYDMIAWKGISRLLPWLLWLSPHHTFYCLLWGSKVENEKEVRDMIWKNYGQNRHYISNLITSQGRLEPYILLYTFVKINIAAKFKDGISHATNELSFRLTPFPVSLIWDWVHVDMVCFTKAVGGDGNRNLRRIIPKVDISELMGSINNRPFQNSVISSDEKLGDQLCKGRKMLRRLRLGLFMEYYLLFGLEDGLVHEASTRWGLGRVSWKDSSGRICLCFSIKVHYVNDVERGVGLAHWLIVLHMLYSIVKSYLFASPKIRVTGEYREVSNNGIFKKKELCLSHWSTASAKDAFKKKNATGVQKRENAARVKHGSNFSKNGRGYNGNAQNSWELRRAEASMWLMLINKLSKKSLLPVVIFCFSKNRCDKSADNMTGTDLTSSSEKSEIRVFCDKAFSRLKGSDRNLPQVVRVQSLLRRGIGVHHAGLLPIVKEVVEMLFCRGVIKVLFSTETFAMGVNAPARTVVFDSLRKFDGKEFRQLLPGEYTQMAGRAGRRGLDKIGTVILMCRDEIPEDRDLKHVIVGSATRLESQFRLTYIMILHLLRVEELKVEDMLKRSFAEFHAQKKLPEMQQLLKRKLNQPTKAIECIKGEPTIEEYYETYSEAEMYSSKISEAILQSPSAQQFLTPGRVVVVKSESAQDHLLAVIVKAPSANYKQFMVLVIKPDLPSPAENAPSSGNLQEKNKEFNQGYFMVPKSKRGLGDEYSTSVSARRGTGVINIKLPHLGYASGMNYEVRGVDSKEFLCICNRKIKIDQVGLLEDVSSVAYSKTVQLLLDLKSDGNKYPPALDPVKDLKLKDVELVETYRKWTQLLDKMALNQCHGCIKLEEHIKLAREIKKHKEEVNDLQYKISDEALKQMPDFQFRIDVLKIIGCIDDDLVVQMKGRVACEMNSGEELICTECLFENQLDDLEPEEAVALMSAFVFQQKNTSEPSLTTKLSEAKHRLYKTAIRLGELQAEQNLPINPEEYAQENLKFGLVEVVYEWAKGTPFSEICELTDVPEGLIVRTIVRLDETCREFKNAAAIMGNSALCKKMEIASNAIKRDIVFAASLYITGV
ncbi:DExH-box ATP-dependent RNA helicase DExH11 isoform X2 [Senna tora]|uniref:DExH-box ATP-dependent RNA helicase DExH11 isoform X2 n=1 Tax=Senna tora TaxID=362788 RepID=A0A834WWE6_9FABA|nr:DExH-box ATP-dependent RNA helicase DExH11 isoform X2 [Senna tora]